MRHLKFAAGLMSLTIVTALAGLALIATALPAIMSWGRVVLTSGSMSPLIDPGDVVIAERVQHPIDPGTVVVFHNPNKPGSLVTHRVLEVLPDGTYRTKGDANPQPDVSPVTPDRIIGRGVLLVPVIGLPAVWIRHGHPELAAAAAAVVLLLAGVSRFGLLKKHDPWAATLEPPAREAEHRHPRRSVTTLAGTVAAVALAAVAIWAIPQMAQGAFAASFQNTRNALAVPAPAVSLYLKTNGTTMPPANLAMANTPPTATTLPNYDRRDSLAGLTVATGSSQNWLSTGPVTLSGPVRLTLWSAMANFNTTQAGSINISLWDCNTNGYGCTQLATVTSASTGSWSGGSNTWVAKEFNLSPGNRQTTRLQLRVTVNTSSQASMMFAYDTTTYQSRVTSG